MNKFQDSEVVAGAEIQLICKFAGSPEVRWFKDGGPLEENDRISCVTKDNVTTLTIERAEPDDEGWYRCRLTNEQSVCAHEAEVIVIEAPKFVNEMEDVTIDEG